MKPPAFSLGYPPSPAGRRTLERVRAFLADVALPMVEEVEAELGDTAFALEPDGRLADDDDRAQAADAAGFGAGRPLLPPPALAGRPRPGLVDMLLRAGGGLPPRAARGAVDARLDRRPQPAGAPLERRGARALPGGLPGRAHERGLRPDGAGRRHRRPRAPDLGAARRRRLGPERRQAPHHRGALRRARPGARARRGRGPAELTAFLVELDAPGVVRGPVQQTIMADGQTGVLEFHDVRLADAAVVGREGGGLALAFLWINWARSRRGGMCSGLAPTASSGRSYGRERRAFGRPIGEFGRGRRAAERHLHGLARDAGAVARDPRAPRRGRRASAPGGRARPSGATSRRSRPGATRR